MRVLVGLACVAIVAFVGYFFWGEWQATQREHQFELLRAEVAANQTAAMQRLAAINEVGQDMATLCGRVQGWYVESETSKRTFESAMSDCLTLGHVQ